MLLPIIISSFIAADSFYLSVAILLCIFFIIIFRASRRLHDIVTSSLQLQYENLALVKSLALEKNKLDNRLGRILNDSSNELYIADASSLNYLQVNKGVLENVGYSEPEVLNLTLLDTIVDLDTEKYNSLIKLLRAGTKESVSYITYHRRKNGSTYPAELR
ncbi:MAG: PAS domain S-box protein [Deltaproteobacteria bacterium]|nr:PAS domain S-box protein [Deltaproteobacteria bacterium]